MKKHIFAALMLAAGAYSAKAQYGFTTPVGITANLGGIPAVINVTTCTPPYGYLGGAIWNTVPLDFTRTFRLDYDARVDWVYSQGADGICVVFKQNSSLTSQGSPAGYMGYYNGVDFLSHSFAVEFDDFDNGSSLSDPSPYYDHIMIAKNGSYMAPDIIAGPVPILPAATTIQDSMYHHYTLEWDCSKKRFTVYVDGDERLSTYTDMAALFSNPTTVNWGFTGGIGSSGANHLVTRVSVHVGEPCAQDCNYEPGLKTTAMGSNSYQFDLNPNPLGSILIAGYIWDFNDGSPAVTTVNPFVTHTYATSSIPPIHVRILGYNLVTEECCVREYDIKPEVRDVDGHRLAAPLTAPGSDILVAPNPGNSIFKVSGGNMNLSAIEVFDMNGKKVMSSQGEAAHNKIIDLSNQVPGTYLFLIRDEAGRLHNRKVILTK